MRIFTQFAAVTQLRTGLLLEVVFGVRATIAGCDAAVGSVTTVLPTTTFFSSVLWTTGPCYFARICAWPEKVCLYLVITLITVIPRQCECHIQRYGSFAKQTTESL